MQRIYHQRMRRWSVAFEKWRLLKGSYMLEENKLESNESGMKVSLFLILLKKSLNAYWHQSLLYQRQIKNE